MNHCLSPSMFDLLFSRSWLSSTKVLFFNPSVAHFRISLIDDQDQYEKCMINIYHMSSQQNLNTVNFASTEHQTRELSGGHLHQRTALVRFFLLAQPSCCTVIPTRLNASTHSAYSCCDFG
mmetsp:Transcript_778/g.2619  ORF Transcript_778/g.2619 Transcript_778/m.2619 type:complete len:121 (+) Transcript_778:42-404(+)